jgi:hypothetical protein
MMGKAPIEWEATMMRAHKLTGYQPLSGAVAAREVLDFLRPLSDAYPGIDRWFANKVIPMLGITRHVVTIERQGKIAAVGIAKNECGEKKMCTVRVAPPYQGSGMGLRVMDDLMRWLGTDTPLATVSEEQMPAFERIFSRYGFSLTSISNGLYRPKKLEFMFNEPASPLMRDNQNL